MTSPMTTTTVYLRHLVLAALVMLLLACSEQDNTTALGTLERDMIHLSATDSEIITDLFVNEGDEVNAGDKLLQLDNTAATAEVARARANLDRADAYYREQLNGARTEELAAAQARLDNTQARFVQAKKSYERTLTLVEQKQLSQAQLDEAVAQRDVARATVDDAREQLALLVEGTRKEQVDQAKAQWQEAQQALVIAEKKRDDLLITATRKGRIDSLPRHRGERVSAGTLVVVMLSDDNPHVRAYVPESVRAGLIAGQQLRVTIDGIDKQFSGTLTHIQKDPAFTPHYALTETERSRLMYLAEVQLSNDARDIPSGIPAQVIIAKHAGSNQSDDE